MGEWDVIRETPLESFAAQAPPPDDEWGVVKEESLADAVQFQKVNKALEDRVMVGQRAFEGMTQMGEMSRGYDDQQAKINKDLEDQVLVGQRAFDQSMQAGEMSRGYDERNPTTLRQATNIAKAAPYGVIKAVQGLTAPLSPVLKPFGTPQMLEEAAQYWKPESDINIPDIGVGIEKGRPVVRYQPTNLVDLYGGLAEGAGAMAGPIPAAMKAGRLAMGESTMGPAAQRIGSGVVGGALLGEGDPKKTLESAAMFGAFEAIPALSRAIKGSSWYRGMTIPERGMVAQSFDDMIKRGYSEGEILRRWNNPEY